MGIDGDGLGCKLCDEVSGNLTLNIGTIELEKDEVLIQANLRFPASFEYSYITDVLRKGLDKFDFGYTEKAYLPPIYIDPKSEFVKVLLDSYRNVTMDDSCEPFSIGGATYARTIPNAAAFGPLFPYEEELAHGLRSSGNGLGIVWICQLLHKLPLHSWRSTITDYGRHFSRLLDIGKGKAFQFHNAKISKLDGNHIVAMRICCYQTNTTC